MKNKSNASLSLRKLVLSVLATAPLATLPVPLWALPSNQTNLNNQVNSMSSGVTVTSTSATRVDVSSTATNSVIKWNNFGDGTNMTIGSGDTVNYALPSSSSSVLNMVTGTTATTINGTLSSNGNIFVLNPNGVTVGATGVITANGVGLSTVPETEFTFQGTGNLGYVENNSTLTSQPVVVSAGASITAASGSGNVWIAGKGATLSGTIDTGVLWVKSLQSGNVTLDTLTVGDATAHAGNVTVASNGGSIITGNAVMVYGPSVTLTSGNGTISQSGTLVIGAGSPTNATLTTNSGSGNTTLANVQVNGTGLLTVAATSSGTTSISSGAGKIAVTPETGTLTINAAGDLTLNAGNATDVTATSSTGNILSGGLITGTTGNVSLTAGSGKNIAYHTKAAVGGNITFAASSGNLGTITYTQDSGDFAVPTTTAGSISISAGNITLAGTQTITNGATYTATGNVTLGQTVSAGSLTATAGIDVSQTSTVDTATAGSGTVAYTATGGNVSITGTIGATKAPATLTVSAGKLVSIGAAVKATDTSITAGTDLSTTAAGTIAGAGNVTLVATAGNVTLGAAIGGATTKNVTITAGKNATIADITASAGSTVAVTAGGDLTQTGTDSTGATGNVTFVATAGNVTTAAITSGNITVTGGKLVTLGGAIAGNAGPVTIKAGTDLTQNAGGTIATSGDVSITATGGNVTLGDTVGAGNATISSGAKLTQNANVTVTNSANLTSTGNITLASSTLKATDVTVSAPYITETGTGLIDSSGTTSITTTDSVAINGANTLNNLKLVGAPNGASVKEANGFTLADGTATTGNVTVTITGAGAFVLGNASADKISVGKDLNVTTTGSNVSDKSDNITVSGNLTLSTGAGAVVLDGGTGQGVGLKNSYGQVNITTTGGAATVYENTTLNLGAIDLGGGSLTAYSASGIINSGQLKIANATVGAGTAAAPGAIALNYDSSSTHNLITGTVNLMTDLGLLNSTTVGNYLASSLTIVNGGASAKIVDIPANVYGNGTSATISLKAVNGSALNVGALNTTGAVSLETDTGAITANDGGNTFTNVTVTSGDTAGASAISSTKDLTANGNITSSATKAFTFTSGGNLTIGAFNSGGSGLVTFDTVTSKGSITDSAPGIFIYGDVAFNGGSVSITKAGHNFGGITIDTSANKGNATIVEGGTSKYASIKTGTGSFTGTSTSGNIIQTGAIVSTGMVTLSAVNGSVTADNASNDVGNVSITSKGDSTLVNGNATVLGAVAVGGNFTVTTAAAKDITQKSGTSIWTYGATSFVTGTTGNITLSNSGNQFGALTLTTGSGAINVKESTTLNLKSATTTGAFSATSENADIIDSGAVALSGASAVSFNAKNNISLTKDTADYPSGGSVGVKLTAGGNATITDANSITLGASTIGGNLTVTAKTGNINQVGVLNVGGTATFLAAAGALTLDNTANTFGPVKFSVAGTSVIDEATTFNLLAGSFATGAVTINTGGDFITSGSGGSSFTNNLTINAPSGSIKPGAGSLLVTGTFTVNASGTKDLSGLDYAGNLASKAPVNQGSGNYIKAQGQP